jgi:4-amino-4-deoxy-L-arabinose transferase-like glycosyltransferase
MKILANNASKIILSLTLIGAFLHFYNLSWGAPYHFHPDERNVASAISQLQFPNQMNPNFFAYGSLPIYTVFFTGILSKLLSTTQVTFEQAIIMLRMVSALFATALIPLVYIVVKDLLRQIHKHKRHEHEHEDSIEFPAIVAAFFTTFSTGMIQFAHFGTFEMWLTAFTLLLFWLCLKVLDGRTFIKVVLIGLTCGILVATKISHLVIFAVPFFALLFYYIQQKKSLSKLKRTMSFLFDFFTIMAISAITYALTNPYVFFDTPAFLASMNYESSVGLNTLPVFYTQGFYGTVPVIYQFINIYPFLINPLLTMLLVPSFFFLVFYAWKTKSSVLMLLICTFLILFLSQSVLFIKWTRYLLPTLPFVFIVIALTLSVVLHKTHDLRLKYANFLLLIPLLLAPPLFSLSYFVTAFIQPDTRITAVDFARDRIGENTPILTETYDIGITAFNPHFTNITIYNTYDLDTESAEFNKETWYTALASNDYIILPSQRVLQTRILNPEKFPVGNEAYRSLLDETAGYTKIYQTPCDIFCQIAYLGDPVYHFEQTAYVFDRPTVFMFQKTNAVAVLE